MQGGKREIFLESLSVLVSKKGRNGETANKNNNRHGRKKKGIRSKINEKYCQ